MKNEQLLKALDELRGYIQRDVAGGFRCAEEICTSAVEVLADDYDPEELRPYAEQMTQECLQAHAREQETWPSPTDCDRLDAAFAQLEQAGIVARQNFSCCGNCGASEIWDEMENASRCGQRVRGYTFYHMQDTEAAVQGHGVYLGYGAVQEGEEKALQIARDIVAALERQGLTVDWDGQWATRILVRLDWKRRR